MWASETVEIHSLSSRCHRVRKNIALILESTWIIRTFIRYYSSYPLSEIPKCSEILRVFRAPRRHKWKALRTFLTICSRRLQAPFLWPRIVLYPVSVGRNFVVCPHEHSWVCRWWRKVARHYLNIITYLWDTCEQSPQCCEMQYSKIKYRAEQKLFIYHIVYVWNVLHGRNTVETFVV
jgi:hypothetical protein